MHPQPIICSKTVPVWGGVITSQTNGFNVMNKLIVILNLDFIFPFSHRHTICYIPPAASLKEVFVYEAVEGQ